jgi:hypothetical protein
VLEKPHNEIIRNYPFVEQGDRGLRAWGVSFLEGRCVGLGVIVVVLSVFNPILSVLALVELIVYCDNLPLNHTRGIIKEYTYHAWRMVNSLRRTTE